MQTVPLPGSDLVVSRLAFGCWGVTTDFHWGSRDEEDSIAAMRTALDAGVNFFDTAEVYGNGASEILVGKALKGHRNQVVIASKMAPSTMREAEIIECCEKSLQRLGTDHLDLYQTHWTNRNVPLAESWGALIKLQEQGKVRAIGVCNMGVSDLGEVCPLRKPVADQLPYNLIWRAIEHEILPCCRRQDIGVLAYSPLMHGLLADKYRSAAEVPDGRARSRHFRTERELARHGEPGCETETFAALDAIRGICAELHRSMADVALAWVAAQPGVTSVIAGARNAEQVRENVATLNDPLPPEIVARLSAVTEPVNQALGSNPDMWDGGANSRYR